MNPPTTNSPSPSSPSNSSSEDDRLPGEYDNFKPSVYHLPACSSDLQSQLREKIKLELESTRGYWTTNFRKGKQFGDEQWKSIDPLKFWLSDTRLKTFTTILPAVKVLLSVPGSSSRIESSFSHAGIIKSRLRNRMAAETLESVLFVELNLPKLYPDDDAFAIEVSKEYKPKIPFYSSACRARSASNEPRPLAASETVVLEDSSSESESD